MSTHLRSRERSRTSLAELVPPYDVAYGREFEWGQVRVTQAAVDAYGLVLAPQGPDDQLGPVGADLACPAPIMPMSVWILSPDQGSEHHHDMPPDELLPQSNVVVTSSPEGILLVAALNETHHAAAQNILYDLKNDPDKPDYAFDGSPTVILPDGAEVTPEEAAEVIAPAELLDRLNSIIHRGAAEKYAHE